MIERLTHSGPSPAIPLSALEYLSGQRDPFAAMVPWRESFAQVEATGVTRRNLILYVGQGYFEMLGVRPVLGRLPRPREPYGAVVSFRFWRERFGGTPGVIGTTIRVGRMPVPIIAVLNPNFRGLLAGYTADLTLPLEFEATAEQRRDETLGNEPYYFTARLRPGVPIQDAAIRLQGPWLEYLKASTPPGSTVEARKHRAGATLRLVSGCHGYLYSVLREIYAGPLIIVLGMGLLVLIAMYASIAGIVLARNTARHHEFVIMRALGAARRHVACRVLRYIAKPIVIGGVAATLVAWWVSIAAESFLPRRGINMGFDRSLGELACLLIAAAISLTFLLCALLSVRQISMPGLLPNLNTGVRTTAGRALFRWILVSAQIAITTVLTSAACAATYALLSQSRRDLGFPTEGLYVGTVIGRTATDSPVLDPAYIARLNITLRSTPGVVSVGLCDHLLFQLSAPPSTTVSPSDRLTISVTAEQYCVLSDFFDALALPILSGRPLRLTDTLSTSKIVIVNEVLARKLWPSDQPVGRFISLRRPGTGSEVSEYFSVVGVSKAIHYSTLNGPVAPAVYMPCFQKRSAAELWRTPMFLYFRSSTNRLQSGALAASVEREVEGLGRQLAVTVGPARDRVAEALSQEKTVSTVALLYAGLTLIVSCTGLYAIMSFLAAARRRELGIRLALGATKFQVTTMLVKESLRFIASGISVGAILWFGMRSINTPYIPVFSTYNWLSYVFGSLAVALVSVTIAFREAASAASAKPVEALRHE